MKFAGLLGRKVLFAQFRHQLFILFVSIILLFSFVPIITYAYFAQTLQSKKSIMNKNNTGVVLYDRTGKPFFTFYQGRVRDDISLDMIPKHTQQAIIAIEDKDFYKHPGFSIKSIIRSAFANIQTGDINYGGSTITQQLVKNSLLSPKKDFIRKYQEIVLAQEINRRYEKNEVLEMYLKSVYFGMGSFGVDAAAKTYFGKGVNNLTLAESALIAALLPSPSSLNPFTDGYQEAKKRQEIILDRMYEQGYIPADERDRAKREKIVLVPSEKDINTTATHFALLVRDELVKKYGEERVARSGFKVYTTLDLEWQKYAEEVVASQVTLLKSQNVSNGSAVVMDPKTGEVRVLVGSKDWYDDKFGKVNVATSLRPSGSAFKPIIYLAAFDNKLISSSTILRDEPRTFNNFDEKKLMSSYPTREAALTALGQDPNAYYRPQNYDRKFRGPVLPRRALANSLNVPSVEVMEKVGVENGIEMAKKMGITSLKDPSNYGLSLILGTAEVRLLDMVDAYAVLANQGVRNDPVLILRIEDKGEKLIFKSEKDPVKVVDAQPAFIVSSILSDSKARKEIFGNSLDSSFPAAVKTGTTEDYKDAWTIGYLPNVVVGVWVGNNDNRPMSGIAGSLGAAPIWKDLMEKFAKELPKEVFTPPSGLVKLAVCQNTATPSASIEYFLPGTEPTGYCNFSIGPSPSPKPAGSTNPQLNSQTPDSFSDERDDKRKGNGRKNREDNSGHGSRI
ncbi:PBP1A family penicillin-binding protein [Candidatus Daviesbacteria bacterium]|nr:PBP1A family penicillin-binding protein [Candidatus Daviesbacteria bacterium]